MYSFADKPGRILLVRRRMGTARVELDWDTDTSTIAGRKLESPAWLGPYGCLQAVSVVADRL